MKAILFGSIGTLADTSELQRAAFNEAFRQHGLDWSWDRERYRRMLGQAGGRHRIEAMAANRGIDVDAKAIHETKSRLFRKWLAEGRASARAGVADLLTQAAQDGLPLGLVTTTEGANVLQVLNAIDVDRDAFHTVVSREDIDAVKPAPDCYLFAASRLATAPENCLAIEDNPDGVRAALTAGMACMAWPNENTEGHDFTGAIIVRGNIRDAIYPSRLAAE